MQQTTNYNFNKPEMSDTANIQAAVSDNMDAIDAALNAHEINNANPHGVTAAQLNAQIAYTSLGQIGLTIDTANSYAAVHNAMPENSTLTISWTGATSGYGAFGQLMPADYGTCVIRKNQVSSWTFYKYDTGIVYSGTYTAINNAGWTEWKNCTIQMPSQTIRYDMGGCADAGSSFRAYGPVTVTKYVKWAKIDFALSIGNVSWGSGVDPSNYYAYGIPIATLNNLTGMTLNGAKMNSFVTFPSDETMNGPICGGLQQKGAYLCPGRWYFDSGISSYKFGVWTANAVCNDNGSIWRGTINISE